MCHLNAQAKMDISITTQQLVQVCCYKRALLKMSLGCRAHPSIYHCISCPLLSSCWMSANNPILFFMSHGLPWWPAPDVLSHCCWRNCVSFNHATGFLHLFTCWCTGLFLTFGFYKYNWYEHSWASLCGQKLCFLQVNTQKWSPWIVIVGVYL